MEEIKNYLSKILSSSLFKTSIIYTISSIINAAIPFILLPILTRELTPSDYGIVAMFQLVVGIIYPFIGINLDGSIQRKYYDKDKSDFPSYIGTCFILFLISFLIISSLFYTFINYIGGLTKIQDIWIKYIIIVAACQFITSIVLVLYQIKVKPIKYGILQISQSIINLSLTILFVVILHRSWEGRLEAQIITGIVFALISFIILYKSKLMHFNVKGVDIKHALSFGLPLIPHALGGILFTSIDRFFLTNLIGLEQTGNYTVAYQIGAVISLFTIAFNNAYVPWLFDKLSTDDFDIKKKIVKFTYIYFAFLIFGAIFLILFFPIIVSKFVGKGFSSVDTYSTFIVFGFVFQGMYFMVTNYIIYAHKTYIQAMVTISVALIKLPITYFGILWFGAVGASISYCLTFFLFFVATWILSTRVYKMPWGNIFSFKTLLNNGN